MLTQLVSGLASGLQSLALKHGFGPAKMKLRTLERTAEANWRATSLPGIVNGTFAKEGDEQAEDYIAREEMLLDLYADKRSGLTRRL